ncbi:TonB-dependent receptor domain-containing protein [Pseudomonadota bacterium]
MISCLILLLISCDLLAIDAGPGSPDPGPLKGKPLVEVLDTFSGQGIELLYSSSLVTPDLVVLAEPASPDPIHQIEEILQPYGLMLKLSGGKHLVVKRTPDNADGHSASLFIIIHDAHTLSSLDQLSITVTPGIPGRTSYGTDFFAWSPVKPGDYTVEAKIPGYLPNTTKVHIEPGETELLALEFQPGLLELEKINVSTSRYVLLSNSEYFIDQQAIQALPELGDDPVRAVQRLQGTAASGVSSMAHIRGGLKNENSIYLNGLKLLEPYHVRDYHSVFSYINSQAISGIQAYTGAFPVEYGDAMSGVLVLDSAPAEKPLQTTLGVSFYNTSVLNSGHSAEDRVDWLFSARRSNIDFVLDDQYGEPNYYDVFGTLGLNLSPDSRLTFNALWARDDLSIITESAPMAHEESISETHNMAAWINLEQSWNDRLSSVTMISANDFSNRRNAVIEEPLEMRSSVEDYREVQILKLRHAMNYSGYANQSLQWGFEFGYQKADYRYAGAAEYFGFTATYPGLQNPDGYRVAAMPSGYSYGLFASDRFTLGSRVSLELGIRWDRQTYTEPVYSSQISPRASLLYTLGDNRLLRFSVGRYHQAQGIDELQVEDDVSRFYRPQRADHFIAGYEWSSQGQFRYRLEAYLKNYHRVATRFENLFDPMKLIPEFQPDRIQLDPLSARAEGLEFSVEYTGGENLGWWASYSLSRVTDSISGSNERRSWDQLNALQLGLDWQHGPWEIGLASRLHTGWPETGLTLGFDAATDTYYPVPGARNTEKFNVFYTLDFKISRQFAVRHGELSGFIEVTNTTNRKNHCCVNYRGFETVNGNVVLKENSEYWLPLVPSLGLLWTF